MEYPWRRFWCVRGAQVSAWSDYLADPGQWKDLADEIRSYDAIRDTPCLVLLGELGMGKSHTVQRLAAQEAGSGTRRVLVNLRDYTSETGLENAFAANADVRAWLVDGSTLELYLDSFDECRLALDNVGQVLCRTVRGWLDHLARLKLRVVCRTALWPESTEAGLRSLWTEAGLKSLGPDSNVGVYELLWLRRQDVANAAAAQGLDPDPFLLAIDRADVRHFAARPITLMALLDAFGQTGELPRRRFELYRRLIQRMLKEHDPDRLERSLRRGGLGLPQREAVAARLGLLSAFTGRYHFATRATAGSAPTQPLTLDDTRGLEDLGNVHVGVNDLAFAETLSTTLFTASGTGFTWAHRSYAEFLAALCLVEQDTDEDVLLSRITTREHVIWPALEEVASFLCSARPALVARLFDGNPAVLLRADLDLDDHGKIHLAKLLLEGVASGEIPETWSLEPHLVKLEAPGLADLLRPYITSPSYVDGVRHFACSLARECACAHVVPELLSVALDRDAPLEVREAAAAAVGSLGSAEQRRCLLPLARGEAGDDPGETLRGESLFALWTEIVSSGEALELASVPRVSQAGGEYNHFLRRLGDAATADWFPAAWQWLEEADCEHGWHEYCYRHLLSRMLALALDLFIAGRDDAGVFVSAVSRCVEARAHGQHAEDLQPVIDRLQADAEARRRVLAGLVAMRPAVHWSWEWAEAGLLLDDDLPWVLGEAQHAERRGDAAAAALWAETANVLFRAADARTIGLVKRAYDACGALKPRFAPYFEPTALDGPDAARGREQFARERDRAADRARRESEELGWPQVCADAYQVALAEAQAGDVGAFHRLWYWLSRADRRISSHGDDLTASPLWPDDRPAEQAQLLLSAELYVTRWDGDRTDYHLRAGMHALRLLAQLQPERLDGLAQDTWKKWVFALLDWPGFGAGAGQGWSALPFDRLVLRAAYAAGPDFVLRCVGRYVRAASRSQHGYIDTHRLEVVLDARLAAFLARLAAKPGIAAPVQRHLLELLLGSCEEVGLTAALDALPTRPPRSAPARQNAAELLTLVWSYAPEEVWRRSALVFETDPAFAEQVLLRLADQSVPPGASWLPAVAQEPLVALAERLARHFPSETDKPHYGAYHPTPRDDVAQLRGATFARLVELGAVDALRQIADHLPEQPNLRLWVSRAARRRLEMEWRPEEPQLLLAELQHGRQRIDSSEGLLGLVLRTLELYEDDLRGQFWPVGSLWNNHEGKWWPKEEVYLSDALALQLRTALSERYGITVSREEQPRRTREQTDIVVKHRAPGEPEHQVVIEVKGSWNDELRTAMGTQLVGKYMPEAECGCGLYVCLWFPVGQWDGPGGRPRAEYGDIEAAHADLDRQANDLSTGGRRLRALVLNASRQ
ncbi:MAG: hypothetical protein HYU66_14890 [Armatimonadetes bacterium]|nr:hypothetical protein [Armatimonadota bacterium]